MEQDRMASVSEIPHVAAVAVLIKRGDNVLLVFNEKWSSFTLPMTKIRRLQDPNIPAAHREEQPVDTAARAVAECLGRTSLVDPNPVEGIGKIFGFRQGDRDGIWKRYSFQIFELALDDDQEPWHGIRTEWLPLKEVLNDNRRAISPTARDIVREVTLA
jgi:hypothetical protein